MITGRDAERLAQIGGGGRDRIARVRQRKTRHWRWLWLAVFLAIGATIARFWIIDNQPPLPALIVRWPKPKIVQTVSSGSTFVSRRGSSFGVSLSDADRWNVQWRDENVQGEGREFRWSPGTEPSTLFVRCRAKAPGWLRLAAWFWPVTEMKLHARPARHLSEFRYSVEPPKSGIWLYPHIYAKTAVSWDEQALLLLTEPLVSALQGTLSLSVPASTPATAGLNADATAAAPIAQTAPIDPPLWWIVPSFSSDFSQKPAPADRATYARLNSKNPEDDMKAVAQLIAAKRPQASLRFVVRLDAKSPHGILRLVLDGKGDRKAWVKRAGENDGGPILWPDSQPSPTVSSSPLR